MPTWTKLTHPASYFGIEVPYCVSCGGPPKFTLSTAVGIMPYCVVCTGGLASPAIRLEFELPPPPYPIRPCEWCGRFFSPALSTLTTCWKCRHPNYYNKPKDEGKDEGKGRRCMCNGHKGARVGSGA